MSNAAETIELSTSHTSLTTAGLLHDVGRAAVPNGIWDKPGELSPRERQLAETHSYHTESVLKMSPALAGLAATAAATNERLDGSGYHRGYHAAVRVEACPARWLRTRAGDRRTGARQSAARFRFSRAVRTAAPRPS